jgi:pimeloyl-ACP methyl ester carboxylesterase
MDVSLYPKLDPREEHFRIPGPREKMSLFLRFLPAVDTTFRPHRAVLYVHGATFPSALSIAHRFDGKSWRNDDDGFDVWGLDFYGFGHSDRYPEMNHSRLITHHSVRPTTRHSSSKPQSASFSDTRVSIRCR